MAYTLTKTDRYNIECAAHNAYIPFTLNPLGDKDTAIAAGMKRVFKEVPIPVGVRYEDFMSAARFCVSDYIEVLKRIEIGNRALIARWDAEDSAKEDDTESDDF